MAATPTVFVPDFSDLLVQAMAETQDEYAALKMLHGPFGKWNEFRVVLVRSLFYEYRTQPCPLEKGNWTEKLLDAAAHNDARYIAFIQEGAKQAAKYQAMAEQRREQYAEYAAQNYPATR